MNRRIESLSLMKALQPFIQGRLISASDAQQLVEEYKNNGDGEKLRAFISNPSLPAAYEPLLINFKKYI